MKWLDLKTACTLVTLFGFLGCAHGSAREKPFSTPSNLSKPKILRTFSTLSGFDVFQQLREGNERYSKGKPLYPQPTKNEFPRAVVVSCSDSLTPPETLFDQSSMDLFSVQSFGHALQTTEFASIEYAIETLGVKLLLVLGHTPCQAVQTTVTTPEGVTTNSKYVDILVNHLRPMVGDAAANDPKFVIPIKRNVDAAVMQILKNSPMVGKKVQNGEVIIARGIFDSDTGEVLFWNVGKR